MCGIIGIFGYSNIVPELFFGLNALQHRGQDAAGIVTFNNCFRIKKGLGLVQNVFDEKALRRLDAPAGLGHVRYATQGTIGINEAQPIYMNYPFGLAMVHNGNVTNSVELTRSLRSLQNRIIETSNDLELILYTFASHLERRNMHKISVKDLFTCVQETQKLVKGAYSTITLIPNRGMLAFTDPYGIRPLVLGKRITNRGTVYTFCSETSCLDALGFEFIKELEAGEAVFIDTNGKMTSKILHRKGAAFCVFEFIYFASEDSEFKRKYVASERVAMGKLLGRHFRDPTITPDIVIDVPSSGYFFSSGLAEEIKVPYRRGFTKNKYVGRSFLFPTQEKRDLAVRRKLRPLQPVLKGKKVAVLDDSIIRGTTSRRLVEVLHESGAKKVYFISAAPPVKFPCIYGIDMSIRNELIAANNDVDDIARYIGADAVIYQSLDDLKNLYGENFCYACFSGEYPTGNCQKTLDNIEKERTESKKIK